GLWIDFTVDQPESVAVAIPSIAGNFEHDGPARQKIRLQHLPHRLAFGNVGICIDNTVHSFTSVMVQLKTIYVQWKNREKLRDCCLVDSQRWVHPLQLPVAVLSPAHAWRHFRA